MPSAQPATRLNDDSDRPLAPVSAVAAPAAGSLSVSTSTTRPPLDLRRLEQFVAVVETGSLTDAAARLDVTQQALSVAIRRLEEQVGVTLFIRGRGMRPSPAGLELYESAQLLLAEARHVVSRLQAAAETAATVLRVGFTPDIRPAEVGAILAGRVPNDALVQAEQFSSDALRDRLLAGDVDVVLRRGARAPQGLASAVIGFDRLHVAIRTEDAQGFDENGVSLKSLAKRPLILSAPEARSIYSAFLLSQCRRLRFEPTVVCDRFRGFDAICSPLAVHPGFSLVTNEPGRYFDDRITVLPIREEILAPIQALWLATSETSVLGECIRAIISSEVEPDVDIR